MKQHTIVEEQSRELTRLQAQVAQLRSRLIDQTHDYDLDTKGLQSQLDTERKRFERELQDVRSDNLAERKKRDIQGTLYICIDEKMNVI